MTNDFYTSLRGALADGLDNAEARGALPEDTLGDIMRVAVGLHLAISGEKDTVIALRGITRRIEKEFPDAKKAADEHFRIWDRTRGKH